MAIFTDGQAPFEAARPLRATFDDYVCRLATKNSPRMSVYVAVSLAHVNSVDERFNLEEADNCVYESGQPVDISKARVK